MTEPRTNNHIPTIYWDITVLVCDSRLSTAHGAGYYFSIKTKGIHLALTHYTLCSHASSKSVQIVLPFFILNTIKSSVRIKLRVFRLKVTNSRSLAQ